MAYCYDHRVVPASSQPLTIINYETNCVPQQLKAAKQADYEVRRDATTAFNLNLTKLNRSPKTLQSDACTTSTTAVTEHFHMCTEDAPVHVRPPPLRHFM